MVIVAYIGWIAYGAVAIIPQHLVQPLKSVSLVNLVSASALFAFWISFSLEKSPWTFYLYIIFPVYFWREVLRISGGSIIGLVDLRKFHPWGILKVLTQSLLVIAALQSMVVSMPPLFSTGSHRADASFSTQVGIYPSSDLECRICRHRYPLANMVLAE